MITSKEKGDIGVANILSTLLAKGFRVSLPWGDSTPYDLIVDSGQLLRIQVKSTTRRKNGALIVKVGSIATKQGKYHLRSHGEDPIDFIIAYDMVGNQCYILPKRLWENIKGGQIFLRLTPSKNKQQKNIHNALQFQNAWHFLK